MQQVGIEFITKGERQTTAAINNQGKQVDNLVSKYKVLSKALSDNERFQKQLSAVRKDMAAATRLNAQRQREYGVALSNVQKKMQVSARLEKQRQKEMAEASRVQAEALRQAQPAMEAYNRSVLGTDKAVKSAKSSADAFRPVLDALDQDAKMAAQSAEEYNRALLGIGSGMKSAKSSADVFKASMKAAEAATEQNARAAKEAAAADAALTREKEQLIQKLNPLRSASMLYEKELNDINRAQQLGVINDRQRQQSLDALNAEFQAYATGAQTAGNAQNRFAQYSAMSARNTNQLGVLMQQTGYQVGDFAVQVQSGTNVMVALGQQATQLVGTFGMLAKSTRMIGLFAGLGIVIPILTAIAGGFMRARGEASSFADELQKLEGVVSDLQGVQDILSMSTEELGEKYGDAAASVREYAQVEAQLQASLARSELEDSLSTLDSLVNKYYTAQDAGRSYRNTLLEIEDAFKVNSEQAKSLEQAFTNFAQAQTFDEQRQAVDSLLSSAEQFGLSLQDLPEPVAQMLLNFLKANRQIEEAEALIAALEQGVDSSSESSANLVKSQERLNELLEKGRQAQLDRNRANMDAIREKEQELKMARLIAEHGRDSVEVVKARAAQEAIAKNLTTENQQKYIDLAVEVYKVLQAVEDTADAAGDIAPALQGAIDQANAFANAMGRAADRSASIGINTAGIQAEVAALERGADPAVARAEGAAESLRQDLLKQLPSEPIQREAGLSRIEQEVQSRFNEALARELAQQRRSELRSVDTGGGGGGTAPQPETGYLDGLLREAELKRRMAGLSEEEARRLEIVNQLKEKELLVDGQLSETQSRKIEQLLEEERITERLIQQKKREEQIQQTVASNIETALMGLVDGTKSVEDAFKGMLRNIILEIYKQQVAQPFAEEAGSFLTNLFFAKGGVFQGGNVTPFANGGVVGGPTFFPMSNGDTGLMGEAGPEAIMPLKRTKGGKLGVVAEGTGDVTVVQNFNISANGDDSVKRILRQEMPRIAEQAKAAVADGKRRGGSYGRAFS